MQSVSNQGWADFFIGIDGDQRWLLLVIAIACSMGLILCLVGILCSTITSIQRHRSELALKREMLDRGMSADEIAKVIGTSGATSPGPVNSFVSNQHEPCESASSDARSS